MHKILRLISVILTYTAVLVVIPVVRGAEHQVTVGGPGGIVKYDPEFIVRLTSM